MSSPAPLSKPLPLSINRRSATGIATTLIAAALSLVACSDDTPSCEGNGCAAASGDIYGATADNLAHAEFQSVDGVGTFVVLTANGTRCQNATRPGAMINLMLSCVDPGDYAVSRDGEAGTNCDTLTARAFTEVDGNDWAWASSGEVTIHAAGDTVSGSFSLDFSGGWIDDDTPAPGNAGSVSGSFHATRCDPPSN